MNFGGGRGKIDDARLSAATRWDGVCEVWNDQTRRDHETEVVEPLNSAVVDVLRAIDRLSTVFASAKRECEFDPVQ